MSYEQAIRHLYGRLMFVIGYAVAGLGWYGWVAFWLLVATLGLAAFDAWRVVEEGET